MRHESEIAELRQAVDVEDSRADARTEECIYWKDQTRAMLAKQDEKIVKYRRLKAKHFDKIDEARRLREERDSLRDEVETKDAIIAKQDESIGCLKASRFDAIDQTEIARAMLAKQDEKIERQRHTIRVRTEDALDLKKQLDGQTTTIKILREQRDQVIECLSAF